MDPHDEPMFSQGEAPAPEGADEGSVHEFDLDSAEEQEAEEWLERNVAEHEAHMPPPVSDAPVSGSILGLSAPAQLEETYTYDEPAAETEQFSSWLSGLKKK